MSRRLGDLCVGLAALCAILLAGASQAKVATPEWSSLARATELAALVRVDEVENVGGVRVASATVLDAGRFPVPRGSRLFYVAQPGWFWTCDDSRALRGETALVLLSDPDFRTRATEMELARLESRLTQKHRRPIRLRAIAWSGRGRLPAVRRAGSWWVQDPSFRNKPRDLQAATQNDWIPVKSVLTFLRQDAKQQAKLRQSDLLQAL